MNEQTIRIIHSEAYGTIEVESAQIIHFPRSIIGLSDYHDYALVRIEDTPYYLLHSLEDDVSFILLPAQLAIEDYGFRIDQSTIDLLGIEKPEDVTTFLIVNIDGDQLYVNLKAPLLLAIDNQRGCQFIIDAAAYPLRYPLTRRGGESC